jgi:replication-associated recombination protein RarA
MTSKDFHMRTKKGQDFFEVSSAFQKSIRRCDEKSALYWAKELMMSNYSNYLWKRMIVMVSEDIGLANPLLPMQVQALKQNYDFLVKSKARETNLPLLHAIMLMVRSEKSRVVDWANGKVDGDFYDLPLQQIPDYAFDKHTRKGKEMGRTIQHFFDIGAHLENHSIQENEMEYRKWCVDHWSSKQWCDEQRAKQFNFKNGTRKQPKLFDDGSK